MGEQEIKMMQGEGLYNLFKQQLQLKQQPEHKQLKQLIEEGDEAIQLWLDFGILNLILNTDPKLIKNNSLNTIMDLRNGRIRYGLAMKQILQYIGPNGLEAIRSYIQESDYTPLPVEEKILSDAEQVFLDQKIVSNYSKSTLNSGQGPIT